MWLEGTRKQRPDRMPPICARREMMAAWSKEVRIEMESKGKIPIKVLEYFYAMP